ncbi:hypothetical protein [Thiohalobacter thiocyanaticus]|uniref:hypothetical protein n=1 Tax=Thiohalobacter thiocyanaticus TaxID=585455 RepID=UPI000F6330CC|nr:hypothetical protein [Thiohalobacter thiocyanaticus]
MLPQFSQPLTPLSCLFQLTALLLLLLPSPAGAPPNDDAWLLEDETDAVTPYDDTLALIHTPPPKDLYRLVNRLRISADSLASGRVRVEQCHENLDPVPNLEIVYRPGRIDRIRIRSHSNIGRARVDGHSVQLQDIQRGARLCLSLSKRMTEGAHEGEYHLRHGPFYRRFLDGYYPMRMSFRLDYPADRATVSLINRGEIAGAGIRESAGKIEVDAHFAGKLTLTLQVSSDLVSDK